MSDRVIPDNSLLILAPLCAFAFAWSRGAADLRRALLHHGQITASQQGVGPGLLPAEADIEVHRSARVASFEHGAQTCRHRSIEHVARLLERLEAVGVEDLGPEIRVIARSISAAREQMLEMRGPVTRADL